ncbi:MAG TPA: hypothetical protein VFY37_13340 [Solirubrobacterales bacterium]|nr:hypothetical protein [Solirubrobacterales bacterium]
MCFERTASRLMSPEVTVFCPERGRGTRHRGDERHEGDDQRR